jgi:hypothetical protein
VVEVKVHIQGPRTRRVFNLISNVKINQLNSIKYNDARADAQVCVMTRLVILGCYMMWAACMKREMKLMIVSGYQLYKLYRLIKIRTIHCFFKNRTTHRSSWAFGILNKI